MKSLYFAMAFAAFVFRGACPGYFNKASFKQYAAITQPDSQPSNFIKIHDFRVHRLSGERVSITWHTEDEKSPAGFEVVRRLGENGAFVTVGFVPAKQAGGHSIIDYSMTDNNTYTGSSYYRLKQTDEKGAAFFTIKKAVAGTGKKPR
jgi:hypothetical protein